MYDYDIETVQKGDIWINGNGEEMVVVDVVKKGNSKKVLSKKNNQ
ncbi:hypothetical protein SAMN06265827_105123 [Orenia metallireducens]|uniref:Uncharacterized protein n=1 Tax=Orenia metallireducens TaxID=1413210 RepID=A0A285G7S4_9FIRM|nr:hypothetical protein [Orenia metallireducens]SNY19448.1 hypothetical protein SAMN06265827_105123 [Orenia metallireducens]